jgi:flavodoxin
MKNLIFYFSGTGNSLKVAKSVAGEIGDCGIVPILVSSALRVSTIARKKQSITNTRPKIGGAIRTRK